MGFNSGFKVLTDPVNKGICVMEVTFMSGNCNSAVMSTVVFVLLCLRVRCDGNHKSWDVSNENCDSNIRAKGTNLERVSGPKIKS